MLSPRCYLHALHSSVQDYARLYLQFTRCDIVLIRGRSNLVNDKMEKYFPQFFFFQLCSGFYNHVAYVINEELITSDNTYFPLLCHVCLVRDLYIPLQYVYDSVGCKVLLIAQLLSVHRFSL